MAEYDAFRSDQPSNLSPCGICGRTFAEDVLARHIPICQKTAAKKRKVFDVQKQRVEGTDIKLSKDVRVKPGQSPKKNNSTSKSNWRSQHADFINTIRAARGVQKAMESGGPLPPPPPPTINPDYVQCPYCSRRFNESAAQRHISFCKEQHSRLPNKTKVDPKEKAKFQTRTGYKAPRPKLKEGSTAAHQRALHDAARETSGRTPPRTGNAGGGRTRTSTYGQDEGGYSPQGKTGSYSSPGKRGSQGGNRTSSNNSSSSSPGKRGTYKASMYEDEDDMEPTVSSYGQGRALRTGKTQQTYEDGKRIPSGNLGRRQQPTRNTLGSPMGSAGSGDTYNRYSSSPLMSDPSPTPPPYSGRPSPANRNQRRTHRENDNGYHSNSDGSRDEMPGRGKSAAARFCHECGTKYPVMSAKFCCECGMKRVFIT